MPDFGIFRAFNEKLFGDKLYAGQLPTQLGLIGSEDFGFDPDYIAILDYAITQAYTLPSASQQELQNQLILDLKDAGVWSKLDLFYVFATDGDSDFATINWKDPNNYELIQVNSPTFTTNIGFTGNGSSSYLNTNTTIDIGGNFNESLSIGSFGGYLYNGFLAYGNQILGTSLSTNTNIIRGGSLDYIQSNLVAYGSSTPTEKWFHLNTDSVNANQFVNGVQVANRSAVTSPTDNGILWIMRDAAGYSISPTSVVFTGGDLSSEQNDFYTTVDSYMTSI